MISAFVFSPAELSDEIIQSADLVHVSCIPYLLGEPLPDRKSSGNNTGSKLLLSFPFISKGKAYRAFCERFGEFSKHFDGFTLQNIGDYETLCELMKAANISRSDIFAAGDVSLNITNASTAEFWRGKLDSAAILPELDIPEHRALIDRFPEGLIPEVALGARKIVMRSEHCFAAEGNTYKCGKCGRTGLSGGSLFDISGKEFPVVTNPLDCNSILLFPAPSGDSGAAAFDYSSKKAFFRVV